MPSAKAGPSASMTRQPRRGLSGCRQGLGRAGVAAVAATLSAGAATASVAGPVRPPSASQYNKENPFPARLSVNQKITGRDSTKDIRTSRSTWKSPASPTTGDALGIWFDNDADLGGRCWP